MTTVLGVVHCVIIINAKTLSYTNNLHSSLSPRSLSADISSFVRARKESFLHFTSLISSLSKSIQFAARREEEEFVLIVAVLSVCSPRGRGGQRRES